MKEAFERAVHALDCFRRARRQFWQRVNLMCVLLHDNLDQVAPLIRLAAEHGANFMIQFYSHRRTGSKRYFSCRAKVSPRLLELRRRYPDFLSNPAFLAKFDRHLGGGVPGCRAGRLTAFRPAARPAGPCG